MRARPRQRGSGASVTSAVRRVVRRVEGTSLLLLLSLGTMAGFGATPTMAAWTDNVDVSGTTVGTAAMAAPTSLSVSQTCVSDPMPVRRSGAGGVSFTSGTASPSMTIAKPSSAVAGDVLIAGVGWVGNWSATTPTAPSGWTLVNATGDNASGHFIYSHVVGASEPSGYTWTGIATNSAGGIVDFTGVDTTKPVDVSGGQNNTSSQGTATAPSVTTTRANDVILGFFGLVNQTTMTAPGSMSTDYGGASSGTGLPNTQVTVLGGEEPWATPGATGTRAASAQGGSKTVGILVAVEPPQKPYATATWTPSTSTYATGQTLRLTSGATVLWTASLPASTSSQYGGPLVSGTSYSTDVVATYQSWVSPTASSSFTGRTC